MTFLLLLNRFFIVAYFFRMTKCVFVSKIRLVEAVETKSISQLDLAISYLLQLKNPLEQPKVSDITAQIALVLSLLPQVRLLKWLLGRLSWTLFAVHF